MGVQWENLKKLCIKKATINTKSKDLFFDT